jgi:large subunit ribosomal protein L25
MATTNRTLAATPRTETGKGAARSLRRSGQVPAIIYGHSREPQNLAIGARELEKLLEHVTESTVIELSLGTATSRTLIREIQRHPFRKQILHVDFQELVAGEKIHVRVPLVFTGIAEGVRVGGGIMETMVRDIEVEVDPASMPDHINVDVSNLTIGHSLHLADIVLPAGVVALGDEEMSIVAIAAPKASDTPLSVEAIAAPAEPELIRKTKEDDEV